MAIPRNYQGLTVLGNGFRPFFLLGAMQAALAILVWLPAYYGELTLSSAFTPRDWHVHEMLYGYLPAIVTGFLFTAIPNWTGRLPIRGLPLLTLVTVWLAGRIAVTLSAFAPWWAALLIDASFLLLVVLAAAREIVAGRNWRNLPVVAVVGVLCAGNIAFHLEVHLRGSADDAIRVGVAVIVLLLALIGGRITPSFTRNWLVKHNPGRLPAPFGRFDMAVVVISALSLLGWIVVPDSAATGLALAAAGMLHAVRLARWAGDRTLRERLLVILHVGYAFVPLGFLINAAASFGWVLPSAGLHAWMVGAAGIMTLAVMTRATLGHTGQALTASVATQVIYLGIIVAAVTRVCAVLVPAHAGALLHVAAFAWIIAFSGFALAFGPLLLGLRLRALAIRSTGAAQPVL
ncbi:NnrS family protein [Bradyrhizobium sp. 83012]|uniref:NnrS family protein n=1 Tax=Bradyrhizobium aeschynomenes TaxID=2734909 RepID=A0ABX2C943_9BRAD|nr:NnrS family protein [Bradyrhizobium aeschynomenes]NPU14931.1 NnrS family protein [Bradyrhizobium aeschynomenes]NPU64799.1 NnrS family protein [Bradyrhizobium aeschynomenes]